MKQAKTTKELGFALRPLKKSDYKTLAKRINDRSIYRFTTNIPYPYSVNDAKKWLDKVMRRYRSQLPDAYDQAIEIDGELGGSISLMKIEKNHKPRWDIGWPGSIGDRGLCPGQWRKW